MIKKIIIFSLCSWFGTAALIVVFVVLITGGAPSTSCAPAASGTAQAAAFAPKSAAAQGAADTEAIFQAVSGVAKGDNWIVVSMLTGSYLESTWNQAPPDGIAFGPFQIQMPGVTHPDISVLQAMNIPYATQYMYPAYLAASRREEVQSQKATNPQAAAEANAYYAERPQQRYSDSQGPGRVAEAFQASLSLMRAHGMSTDFGRPSLRVDAQAQAATITVQSNSPCSGGTTSPANAMQLVAFSGATGTRQHVLDVAKAQLGLPYAWGGGNANGPTNGICASGAAAGDCLIKGFDCSGLVVYALAQSGIQVPRTAATQWSATSNHLVVPPGGDIAKAQAGDLVFFTGSDGSMSSPGHVGIYVGDGQMINAPQSGENVKVVSIMTSYWQNSLVGVTDPYAKTG